MKSKRPGNEKLGGGLWWLLYFFGLVVLATIVKGYSFFPSDFGLDYQAALALRHGTSLYGPDAQRLFTAATGLPGSSYFHPPFNALLAWPFSFLDYQVAFVLFNFLSLTALALLAYLLATGLGWRQHSWLVFLAGLFWFPVWACVATGQVSMLVALLVIAGWFWQRRGHQFGAGSLIGLAILLKLYPGLLALLFLIRGNYRTLLGMISCLLVGWLLPVAVWGGIAWQDLLYYVTVQMPLDAALYVAHPLNIAFYGAFSKLFGPASPLGLQWVVPWQEWSWARQGAELIVGGGVFLTTLWFWWRQRRAAEALDSAYCLGCLALLLLAPLVWQHYLIIVALPWLFLLKSTLVSQGRVAWLLLLLLLLSLPDALLLTELESTFPGPLPYYWFLLFHLPTLALLGLYLLLLRHCWAGLRKDRV